MHETERNCGDPINDSVFQNVSETQVAQEAIPPLSTPIGSVTNRTILSCSSQFVDLDSIHFEGFFLS